MAPPRMQLYIDYSAEIYSIYLKYISKDDIHVYSIDEVFMDVTDYLEMYHMSGQELGIQIMKDILKTTGITSSCGTGTNLYLAKIAMDILAKHGKEHIAVLDEESYRKILWRYRPMTDFWRIGRGIAGRLERAGMLTMEDVAMADPALLYRMFGVDAELLIDHAWGRETTTIYDIKNYKPKNHSVSSGQVLSRDYSYEEGRLIVKEMVDLLCLELVDKGLVTDSITLHVGYSNRLEKKPAHGTVSMTVTTSSAEQIRHYTLGLYERIMDPYVPIRRVTLTYNHVVDEIYRQYDLFTDPDVLDREYRMQKAMLDIKDKYGKNAILKGMNLQEGGTTRERNGQIGGHKSGI